MLSKTRKSPSENKRDGALAIGLKVIFIDAIQLIVTIKNSIPRNQRRRPQSEDEGSEGKTVRTKKSVSIMRNLATQRGPSPT